MPAPGSGAGEYLWYPAAHVHHTHPDTINAIASAANGEQLLGECFGAEAAWLPYIRPGFTLAKQVGSAVRADPSLRLVVLAKHGLVVWGDTAEEVYRRTIEVVNRAADFVNSRAADKPRFGGQATTARLETGARRELLNAILPAVRGAVSSERAKVLAVETSDSVQQFVSSKDVVQLVARSRRRTACGTRPPGARRSERRRWRATCISVRSR